MPSRNLRAETAGRRVSALPCRLEVHTDFPHVQQVLTGFILLAKAGIIDLDLRADRTMADDHPARSLLFARVGDVDVAYDVADGYYLDRDVVEGHLEIVGWYFKRSFDEQEHKDYRHAERILPLGMNYHVTTDHPVFARLARANVRSYVRSTAKRYLRRERRPHVTTLEDVPRRSDDPKVVFLTRTWDPDEMPGHADREARRQLNEMRADCIRALRDEFGERFTGGLWATPDAKAKYADVVVSMSLTRKDRYLALMREADIGIATRGLYDSTGWKMGEYVAASKAIVAEHPRFTVPGDFDDEVNYLGFSTCAQCVERVSELLVDAERLYQMKVANYRYYHGFLRPDRLVFNTLLHAVEPTTRQTLSPPASYQ